MAGRLESKRAVITGGASGVGAAAARLFAAEGARVVIVDRQAEPGRAVADEIKRSGREAHFYHVDVSSADEVRDGFGAIRSELGGVDVLFNHAGIFIVRKLIDMSDSDWDGVMAVNVKSMFLTCREVLPGMMEQRGGVILNTSSVSGLTANALEIAYCVSKGAILQLTRGICAEYRSYGIRCNAICPGFIRTPHGLREMAELAEHGEEVTDDALAASQVRIAEPEDIAAAALALVSDDTRFVNGAHVLVDNGWVAVT
jgi:NAD(P)-dependent dehydrogenase (short-subunit alcohol dehydrogenase family)